VIPSPWEAALLALAAWRVFHLLAEDDILDTPRRYVTARLSETWQDFITCVYCAGFWISVSWWLAWLALDEWALLAATPWAINAGAIAVQRYVGSDE
jgi:hypothetical protein